MKRTVEEKNGESTPRVMSGLEKTDRCCRTAVFLMSPVAVLRVVLIENRKCRCWKTCGDVVQTTSGKRRVCVFEVVHKLSTSN